MTVLLPLDPEASTVIRIIWLGYAWKLWVFGGVTGLVQAGGADILWGSIKSWPVLVSPATSLPGKPSVPHMVCGPRDKQERMRSGLGGTLYGRIVGVSLKLK